nr:hypothetical protein [Amylibacter sp.]
MTALKKYDRLEAIGLWRESDADQRREVIVSFGASTLVLSDANGKPLTHWSMAAIRTLNEGETPTLYSPDRSTSETLEIDDPTMVDAIQVVRKAIRRTGPHPGRLRWVLTALFMAAALGLGVFWLPSISADYATRILPNAKAIQIGQKILKQTDLMTGTACNDPMGVAALEKFEDWLLPDGGEIHIVDMGARFAAHLPAGNILLNRVLVEENAGPEIAAGFVLMERANGEQEKPMTRMFREIGSLRTLTFIANGVLPDEALAGYARTVLTAPMTRPDDGRLLDAFKEAKLSSAPFAYALDATGKSTAALIALDPYKEGYQPQLTDADWIALQSICGDD